MGLIKPFLVTGLILFVLGTFTPIITYNNVWALILAAIVMTVVNGLVKPVMHLLLLPLNIVSFGLFSVVLQFILLWLVTFLVPGFRVHPVVLNGIHIGEFFSLALVSTIITSSYSIIRRVW